MTVTTTEAPQRKVGILLIIGIVFIPFIFSWFLLRKGHSKISRILGFGWLVFAFFVGLSGDKKPEVMPDTNTPPASTAKPQDSAPQEHKIESSTSTVKPEAAFERLLLTQLGPLNPKWERLEIMEAAGRSYIIKIHYKESATFSGYGEISKDTKRVVRAALQVLMAQGRNPRKEWIFVRVHANQPAGTGETGAALTRVLGKSTYDFNSDQIEFETPE